MVKTFLALWSRARIALAEVAGVAILAVAAYQWCLAAMLTVVGLAVLVKSVEWDLVREKEPHRGDG